MKCYRKELEWDVAADNMSMKAIIQERNHAPILEMQEKMREEAKADAKQDKKRIDEVRKMQDELRQKFIETNNFICECQKKKADIEKKIAAGEAANRKLDEDILERKEHLKRMRDYHENELKPSVEELSVYEEVLQEVVDESDLFQSKEDFIDRCDALCTFYFSFYEAINSNS